MTYKEQSSTSPISDALLSSTIRRVLTPVQNYDSVQLTESLPDILMACGFIPGKKPAEPWLLPL
jgi:hypothetical protein